MILAKKRSPPQSGGLLFILRVGFCAVKVYPDSPKCTESRTYIRIFLQEEEPIFIDFRVRPPYKSFMRGILYEK